MQVRQDSNDLWILEFSVLNDVGEARDHHGHERSVRPHTHTFTQREYVEILVEEVLL